MKNNNGAITHVLSFPLLYFSSIYDSLYKFVIYEVQKKPYLVEYYLNNICGTQQRISLLRYFICVSSLVVYYANVFCDI